VPKLIAEGRENYKRRTQANESDRTVDELKKEESNQDMFVLFEEADLLLDAAKQLADPVIAKGAVDEVSRLKIDGSYFEMQSWKLKGKWAELNGRKLDALLMYHASLGARPVGYKVRGKKPDEVKEGYDRLWKELGGSDDGKGAWLQAVAGAKVAQDGGWEKAPRDWPVWELADLNGKTWKLADLKGKKLLINVWATWCGPCRGEHRYLQTLYDEIKDRNDIQVLTFSIDTSVGDLAPYMKDNKYTFPVLLAADYVNELLPVVGVPQTWIVDEAGKWNWKEEGFGDGEQWKKMVMEKLGIAQDVAVMDKK
jgi:thiol-disulfide isomerase/thioredoxin